MPVSCTQKIVEMANFTLYYFTTIKRQTGGELTWDWVMEGGQSHPGVGRHRDRHLQRCLGAQTMSSPSRQPVCLVFLVQALRQRRVPMEAGKVRRHPIWFTQQPAFHGFLPAVPVRRPQGTPVGDCLSSPSTPSLPRSSPGWVNASSLIHCLFPEHRQALCLSGRRTALQVPLQVLLHRE